MSLSVSQVNAQTRSRTLKWFFMAVVFALIWVIVWLISEPPKAMQTTKNADITSQDLPLPKSIDSLAQFSKEVPVVDISSTVVRDMRNYPAEFKDKRFFEKHAKRWTVQVMDVAQNDIITGYLKGRQDRDKFAYFRYHNSNNELRYILTYGIMGSSQEALGAIKTVDFGLPKSVTPVTERMERYLDMIDKYERTEEIVDSAPNAPRKIKLQATRNEIPATLPKEKEVKKKEPSTQNAQKSATAPKEQPKPKPAQAEKTDRADKEDARAKVQAQPKEQPKPNASADKPKEREKPRDEERTKNPPKEKDAPKPRDAGEPKEKKSAEPMTNAPKTPGSSDD